MRQFLLSACLFATVAAAQTPQHPAPHVTAEWQTKPIDHWHCPKSYTLGKQEIPLIPQCDYRPQAVEQGSLFPFDYEHNEKVDWIVVHRIPRSGRLELDFPSDFIKRPGCELTGDEVYPVRIAEHVKERLVITGRHGTRITFSCHGVLKREET